jgi:formate/nitrite transporter FocA (FNT family)
MSTQGETAESDRTESEDSDRPESKESEPEGNRPGVGSRPAEDEAVAEREVEDTFLEAIDEGRRRLSRRWPSLISTGLVGGIDVGTGVLGLLLVESLTDNVLLGGLAFTIGFIALTLARSELFTEDYLVPVSTVLARQARFRMLMRLWIVTFVANMVGGWVFTFFIVHGYSTMGPAAIKAGSYYVDLGINGTSFCLAILGGAVITLMTWMQHGTNTIGGKVTAAVAAAFLLGAGRLNHTIVASLLMFAALHTGHAPFGYLDWLETALWAALGNMVGGVGLVTLLRVGQAPHILMRERAHAAVGVRIGDTRRVDD